MKKKVTVFIGQIRSESLDNLKSLLEDFELKTSENGVNIFEKLGDNLKVGYERVEDMIMVFAVGLEDSVVKFVEKLKGFGEVQVVKFFDITERELKDLKF